MQGNLGFIAGAATIRIRITVIGHPILICIPWRTGHIHIPGLKIITQRVVIRIRIERINGPVFIAVQGVRTVCAYFHPIAYRIIIRVDLGRIGASSRLHTIA